LNVLRSLLLRAALALGASLLACGGEADVDERDVDVRTDEVIAGTRHLGLGTPADGFDDDDHVIIHDQFALSYNRFRNGPNWVSWIITRDDYGRVGRFEEHFFPDEKLPADFNRVQHWDYGSSGWNRGHLVRSDERSNTLENNRATFRTTNILPQAYRLNIGPWLRFENYCKRVVHEEARDLYVIAGGIYPKACATDLEEGGNHPSEACPTIGKSKDPARRIAVPEKFFKIAVHLPRGRRLASVTPETRVTAIVLPNHDDVFAFNWVDHITSVDAIEEVTGYDFLSKVDEEIQRTIEAQIDRYR
jgi:endonuclease G, mitochondrial